MCSLIVGYDELIKSEKIVYQDTFKNLGDFVEAIPKFIELTLLFSQCSGDTNAHQSELQSFALVNYLQLPFTANMICNQITKGYYLESNILISVFGKYNFPHFGN